MARKISNTLEFFQHKANTQSRTVAKLESKYGNDGYAFLFRLLEILATTENHFLDLSEPADMDYFATRMRIETDVCERILTDLVTWKKIDKTLWLEKRGVWYEQFVKNHSHVYEKRKRQLPAKPIIPATEMQAEPDSCHRNTTIPAIPVPESTHSIAQYSIAQNSIVEDSKNNASLPPQNKNSDPELFPETLPAEPKKPKEKSSAKKEKVGLHLFKDSPYHDLNTFIAAFHPEQFAQIDLPAYYEAIRGWSAENGAKKVNWIETAQNWMRRDKEKGCLKMKSNTYRNNGQSNNTFGQKSDSGNKPTGAELAYLIAS